MRLPYRLRFRWFLTNAGTTKLLSAICETANTRGATQGPVSVQLE